MARSLAADARGESDLAGLGSLSARNPRLLRARLLLARALQANGREGEALRVLDELLAENGEHEMAKLAKAEILAPPRAAVTRVDVGGGEPPARPGGYLPRLKPRS
jgi:Flp pilus assembly protein TadD